MYFYNLKCWEVLVLPRPWGWHTHSPMSGPASLPVRQIPLLLLHRSSITRTCRERRWLIAAQQAVGPELARYSDKKKAILKIHEVTLGEHAEVRGKVHLKQKRNP